MRVAIVVMVLLTGFVGITIPPASAGSNCAPTNDIIGLEAGIATVGTLGTTSNSFCDFSFESTANGASFEAARTAPSSGTVFLYARAGAPPTTSVYDCRLPFPGSFSLDSVTCVIDVPQGEIAYAMVHKSFGFSAVDFVITALSRELAPFCPAEGQELTPGVEEEFRVPAGAGGCNFELPAVAGSDINIATLNREGSGFPLYVSHSEPPTPSAHECANTGGSQGSCSLLAYGESLHILVGAGTGQFKINATGVEIPTITAISPGLGTLDTGDIHIWKVVAPTGSSHATIAMTGPEQQGWACYSASGACPYQQMPDVDMWVFYESMPIWGASHYACRPYTPGSPEICVFDDTLERVMCAHQILGCSPLGPAGQGPTNFKPYAGDGRYFVVVHGYRGVADYLISGTVA